MNCAGRISESWHGKPTDTGTKAIGVEIPGESALRGTDEGDGDLVWRRKFGGLRSRSGRDHGGQQCQSGGNGDGLHGFWFDLMIVTGVDSASVLWV